MKFIFLLISNPWSKLSFLTKYMSKKTLPIEWRSVSRGQHLSVAIKTAFAVNLSITIHDELMATVCDISVNISI